MLLSKLCKRSYFLYIIHVHFIRGSNVQPFKLKFFVKFAVAFEENDIENKKKNNNKKYLINSLCEQDVAKIGENHNNNKLYDFCFGVSFVHALISYMPYPYNNNPIIKRIFLQF